MCEQTSDVAKSGMRLRRGVLSKRGEKFNIFIGSELLELPLDLWKWGRRYWLRGSVAESVKSHLLVDLSPFGIGLEKIAATRRYDLLNRLSETFQLCGFVGRIVAFVTLFDGIFSTREADMF